MSPTAASEWARVGLCARCRHHREVVSDKRARFHLCELSRNDPRFPRYPTLPVLECGGFAPRTETEVT